MNYSKNNNKIIKAKKRNIIYALSNKYALKNRTSAFELKHVIYFLNVVRRLYWAELPVGAVWCSQLYVYEHTPH